MFLFVVLMLQITNKSLQSILKLQHLEDLVLEGCFRIDDDSLAAIKQGCKSLEVCIPFGKYCQGILQFHFLAI